MQHSGWNTKAGHTYVQNFRFSQHCCWRFTFCRTWGCVIECASTSILKALQSSMLGTTHPMTQQGFSLHNFLYMKNCRSVHDFSMSIKLSTQPNKCSIDTDKDDTLYSQSLFKFKPFLYSEVTWPFNVKAHYAPGLGKVFGMFQLTHQTRKGVISSSMKQKADEEAEDPTADKWQLCPTWHKSMECLDQYSHFVHGISDSPEDILKWCRIYRYTLTVFLKKVPNK